jgi:adenosylcobinamide-phosphate synthase
MIVIAGWILDRFIGDPKWLPHPVVLFGRMISVGEKLLNRGRYRVLKGGLMSVFYILLVFITIWAVMFYADRTGKWLYCLLGVMGVFFCLAGKTLSDEVRLVFEAVDRSVPEGRKQVARIVGRDTQGLSAQEIRTAALETLAENLSDGVVAPLFWFAVLGLPGMFAYKMINTLDSMIGYKTGRYKEFGMVAARIDDFANYIPARITALMMITGSPSEYLRRLRFVSKYGAMHASPNSGYPEAALASILDCRFGGSHNYFGEEIYKPFIGENHKDFTTADMNSALNVNLKTEIIALIITAACSCIYWGFFTNFIN